MWYWRIFRVIINVIYKTCLWWSYHKRQCFFIALATALRVSELHALSRSPTCLRWIQDGSVTLQTFLFFVVKTRELHVQDKGFSPWRTKLSLVTYLRGFLHFTVVTSSDQLFQPCRAETDKTTPQLIPNVSESDQSGLLESECWSDECPQWVCRLSCL